MTRAKDTNFGLLENLNSGRFPVKRILMPLIFALVFFACLVILVTMLSGNAQASYGIAMNVEEPTQQWMDTTTVPQSAVYSIRVHNPGTSEESVNLTISFNDPSKEVKGWTVNPKVYTVTGLGASATEYVSVTVTAPSNIQNATANEVAQLTVYAQVVEQPSLQDSDTFIARVTQIYETTIEVKNNDNAKSANQGGTVTYTFIVNNTGNGQDTIDLSVSGTEWKATFSPSSRTLNVGGSFQPTLTLKLDTLVKSTVYPINVIATSQGDPSETGVTSIFTSVNPEYLLSISVSPTNRQEGLPGSTVQYTMTVENLGNTDDRVVPGKKTFGLTWPPPLIDKGQQTILFQSSKSWTLSVSIPDDAKDWESAKVNFTAKSIYNSSGYDEIQTITEVGKVYGIDVYTAKKTNTTDPGFHVYYSIQVTNIGNTNDTITLSTSGDFASAVTPNKLTDLPPDTPTIIIMDVTVPSDALAGFHVNTITATSEDKVTIVSDDVTTEVNPFYDIILLPSGASSQDGEPGGAPVKYQVRIRNDGTDEDTISLTLEGEKPTWAALDRYLVIVPAKGFTIVNLTITVPSGEPIDNWAVVVNGTSTGDPDEWDIAEFEIRVLQTYEVTVSTGDNSNSVPTGSSTKYYLNVKNTGSGYDDFKASAWTENPIATTWASISPSSFGLASSKNKTIVMTVAIPTGTNPGIYTIWFNITSDNESKVDYEVRDSLKTLTEVTQSYSVLIAGGSEQSDETPPKTTISYQIEVWNTGTGEDSLKVEKAAKPTSNHPSWAKLSHNFIQNLMPNEKFILFVNITIPEDTKGDTEDYLKIIIKSDGDPSLPPAQSFVWINTTIIPERDAVLTPHTDIFYREPGDVIVVTLQLTNTGTATDTLTVEDVTPEPYDTWGQIVLPATISLGAGNFTNMIYKITVDQDVTRAESPIKLNLVVKSEGADDDIIEYKNITIHINQTYGVRISSTQSTKTGNPGEEISFKIKVTNEGNDVDTFSFTDFGDELGQWSHTDLELGPDEFLEIYYNITIDPEHDTQDILITLNVSSIGDQTGNTLDTLDLVLHVDPRYEIKLGYEGNKYKEVFGGQSTTFSLTIQNKGTASDTYDIEPIESLDFEILSSFSTISLIPEQKVIVLITVTPNEGTAIGVYDITISVVSQNETSASTEYTFFADVQASYDLFLSTSTTNRKVAAGDDALFTGVKIKNEGNDDDTYTFFITNLPAAWSHDPISDVNVAPGDTVSFNVNIHTDDASPSGLYKINLTARSVNDPTKEMTITLIVEVEQVYGVSITATTSAKTGDIEETLLYLIKVKNEGNGEDYMELTMTGQHTEFATFYYNDTENGPIIHVRPPPGGTLGVYLNVTIPSNYWDIETQNQFTITVKAESLDDPSTTPVSSQKDFITTVNPVYGVDILEGKFTSGKPEETISILFNVKNEGTVTDSFNMLVKTVSTETGGDVSLWYPEITLTGDLSNVAKGGQKTVTMTVNIPFPTDLYLIPPGIYNITVEVSSTKDPDVKDTQVFNVKVLKYYWADIQNTVDTENVNVGETATYTITIKNKGNDVDLLTVKLVGDPDIPGSVNWGKLTHEDSNQTNKQSLVGIRLAAGESTDIILTITIPARDNPAYPTTDPDDVTLTVKVEPSDDTGTKDEVTVTADINTIYEFSYTFLAKTLDVQPGSQAEFKINVENKGTASETFTYEIYQWDKDWSAYGYTFAPSSGNLVVGAGNIGTVTLTINTPSDLEEALSRDYNITIKVHSSAGDIDVFKNCTIHIDPVYDVELITTSKINSAVDVGDNVSYQFSVRNTGNSKETFPFTVSDLDTSSNTGGDQTSWAKLYLIGDLSKPITSVELNPDVSVVLVLNIKVPDADLDFGKISPLQIEVEVTSAQDETISDSFIATTTINPIYDFEFKTPDAYMDGEPGDSVTFTMEVINKGTDTDSYTFSVTDVDTAIFPGATQISITGIPGLKVDGSQTTSVTLSITDKNDRATVGTYPVEITATSENDKSVKKTLILNVEITAVAEVEITPTSQADSGEPGDVVTYKVTITNKGNAEDTFELTLSGTYKNWAEFYDFTGTQKITERKLNATGVGKFFEEITVKVTIPLSSDEETTAGQSYPITIKAASTTTEGVSDTAQVTTTVDEYIDLVLEYSGSGEPRVDFDPNENQPKFRFKVTNNGNIDETGITVNVDDMPTLWNQPTIDFIDILEPGKSTSFSITFNIPSDEDEGEYDIQISVTSTEPSFTSDPVFIIINVTKPDLSISESDVTGLDDLPYLKEKVGSSVTVRATIYNVGHSKAEKVQVKLYEEGTVRGTKTISSIAADSYKTVDFRWTVVAEEVEMKIEVSPLEEIDDGNNAISPIYLDLRPDLSFGGEQINFSKTNPAPNDEITITAFIKNDGGNVEDVAVKFYYGTKVIGTKNIDIDYDETVKAEVSWKVPDEPGKKLDVKVEIDKSGAKGDGDEATKSIEVSSTEIGEIFTGTGLTAMAIGLGLGAIIFLIIGLMVGRSMGAKAGRRREGIGGAPSFAAMEKEMPEGAEKKAFKAAPGAAPFERTEEEAPGEEEEERARPKEVARVRCPKCGKVTEVTSTQRPLQIPCDCGTTLMLKK